MAFGAEEFDVTRCENRTREIRESPVGVLLRVLSEISRRAWATVDDSLFLWRFDVENDVPIELTEEFNGQPIVSSGWRIQRKGCS